jgi:hypothetical protein
MFQSGVRASLPFVNEMSVLMSTSSNRQKGEPHQVRSLHITPRSRFSPRELYLQLHYSKDWILCPNNVPLSMHSVRGVGSDVNL